MPIKFTNEIPKLRSVLLAIHKLTRFDAVILKVLPLHIGAMVVMLPIEGQTKHPCDETLRVKSVKQPEAVLNTLIVYEVPPIIGNEGNPPPDPDKIPPSAVNVNVELEAAVAVARVPDPDVPVVIV